MRFVRFGGGGQRKQKPAPKWPTDVDPKLDSDYKVNHPTPEINPKWRNICSKLRNNHENSELLQKK